MFTLTNPMKVMNDRYVVTSLPCPDCGTTKTVSISSEQLFAYNQGAYCQDVLKDYVNSHSSLLCGSNRYLGIWWDGMNWVLDVCEKFEEKRNALFFGIVRKQLAIWDNAKKQEIVVR